jgi:hypothetical protein
MGRERRVIVHCLLAGVNPVPKDPPKKGQPSPAGQGKPPAGRGKPPPAGEPSGSKDVTSSQIVSTRDLGEPPLPPPRTAPPRRSTTHGVGWYAAEDGDDLAQPVRARRGKWIFLAVLTAVLVAGAAAAYVLTRPGKGSSVVAAAPVRSDAAPAATPPDAAPPPPRLAKVSLSSVPPGAELSVDGKPVGKAPVEIQVPEKATVVVEATLAAHEPWKEQVAVGAGSKNVVARMVPVAADAGPAADAAVAEKKVTKKATSKKAIKKKPPAKRKRPVRK